MKEKIPRTTTGVVLMYFSFAFLSEWRFMRSWRQNIKVNILVDRPTQAFDSCLLKRPSVILNAIKSPAFCAESLVIAKRKLMEDSLL